jgi:hypothetical protein
MAALGSIDPAAIPGFSAVNDTLASWCLSNVSCLPGTMVSAGTAVSGLGTLLPSDDGTSLGQPLAVAMGDPSESGVTYWTLFAKAIVAHMQAFGQVNGATFIAPSPGPGPLTGTALVQFSSLIFVPLLSTQLGVTDPTAAALLEVMGLQTLTGIMQNAVVVPLSISAPFVPYTSPVGGGPITGAGSLT